MKTAITCLKPSSGGLHLGHYIGNIKPLINHQNDNNLECIFMFADLQVFNSESSDNIHQNIYLMMKQILSLGVNPNKVKFFLESDLKKDHMEDFVFLSNFVTTSRVMRLPVFKYDKQSIKMSKFMFPIFQVLDFYITKASIAFSNSDNKALIEFTNEIFRKINNQSNLNLPKIAERNNFTELAIKGKRHLIGIYSKRGQDNAVETIFAEIETLKTKLLDNKKLKEIVADLLRSRAICLFMKEQWSNSIQYAENAKNQYQKLSNYEKYVETFDLIAEGYINLHKWNDAEFEITQGLNAAKQWEQNEKYIKLVILLLNLKISNLTNCTTFSENEFDIENCKEKFTDAQTRCKKVENEQLLYELKRNYKDLLGLYKKRIRHKKKENAIKKGIIHYTKSE